MVAKILAKELDKDNVWEQQQIKEFTNIANQYVLETVSLKENRIKRIE